MQDIVFYAVANETLGVVRDYANARRKSAPVLALGVSVCLRMRLFAEPNNAAPYPIESFNAVTDWQWSMDDDFDRNTACKLVADARDISVHTVTDTINGETMSFTEFVIPISNMNTEELATWIGDRKTRSGLTGELVGYDSAGQAVFVLQVENFAVRNRVAGLADPTSVDEGIVTRAIAEEMIRSAVSASAATKQDTLSSANEGTGISISSAGVISVSDVPQSAVTGLTASLAGVSATLAAKQDTLTAGYRTTIVGGSTVDQSRYFAIEPVITASANQTTTVVLGAGRAYEIHAVASNAKVLLNCEEPVGGTHTFGLEGHIEIFVANTGYIMTGTNVVLANALEPDAVNNLTARFHDGLCILSVEDHVAGYIVSLSGGTYTTEQGTLYYGLATAAQEYIAVDASLNGRTLDMGGAVTNGEKHVVGNGCSDTVLTGGVSCTGRTTFANLGMSGASCLAGTMTLGDVRIPEDGVVGVSGGELGIERVSGGTIALGNTNIKVLSGTTSYIENCLITGGSASNGGAFYVNRSIVTLSGATVTSCSANNGAAIYVYADYRSPGSTYVELSDCTIRGNAGNSGTLTYLVHGAAVKYLGGNNLYGSIRASSTGRVVFAGSNAFHGLTNGSTLVVSISSGAVVNLEGNTNPAPIAADGGITVCGGHFSTPTVFVYSSGGNAGARTFEDLEIRGSTVTNLGLVYGATVYSLAGDDHEIMYTTDDGATSSSVIVAGATAYVVPGALMKVANT